MKDFKIDDSTADELQEILFKAEEFALAHGIPFVANATVEARGGTKFRTLSSVCPRNGDLTPIQEICFVAMGIKDIAVSDREILNEKAAMLTELFRARLSDFINAGLADLAPNKTKH